jgi:hypothetical protein
MMTQESTPTDVSQALEAWRAVAGDARDRSPTEVGTTLAALRAVAGDTRDAAWLTTRLERTILKEDFEGPAMEAVRAVHHLVAAAGDLGSLGIPDIDALDWLCETAHRENQNSAIRPHKRSSAGATRAERGDGDE